MSTPAQRRRAFNDLITSYRRSWGQARATNAVLLITELRAHRWLGDQIPDDLLRMAQRDARHAEVNTQEPHNV